MILADRFGRIHDDLRVSVTDRCNLRCSYCMPAEPVWFDRREILSYEEIERVARILTGAGVRRIRVTGGEPLVRRDVEALVGRLAALPGVEDLSLTTNGVLLAGAAEGLAAAGLRRVNVSLDTLRPDRFAALTGRDALRAVRDGLEAAASAGLGPVKINAVLLRGVNDDEAVDLAGFARERGYELRFIEFMPLENDGTWDPSRVVAGEEIRRSVGARWPLVPDPEGDPRAPATRFLYADGGGALGFIDSVTRPFCGPCGRLRRTSDGRLRVCLYDPAETDIKGPLRAGASDDEILARVRTALAGTGRGGALEILERGASLPRTRTMHQIGG